MICTKGSSSTTQIFNYRICRNSRNCGTTKYELPRDSYLDVIMPLEFDETCTYTFNVSNDQILTFENRGDQIDNVLMIYYNTNTYQSSGNIFKMTKFDTSSLENVTQIEIIFLPTLNSKFLDIQISSWTNHEQAYDVSFLYLRFGEKCSSAFSGSVS